MPSIKHAVNSALQRTTGYILTKADGVQPRTARPASPAPARPRTAGGGTPGGKAGGKAGGKKEGTWIPPHLDEETKAVIRRVKPRTMTSPAKIAGLVLATRYVARHRVPGEIVECGVWRGGSMQAVALTLAAAGDTTRHLHLFDTFEGMPPPTEHDVRASDGEAAARLLATHGQGSAVWAKAGLEDVQQGMAEVDYPAELVHYHQGMVEETIPEQAPEQIAILRLDTDWYASTKHELEHLYSRLSPGGVLIIDDYGSWEGARKATE